MPLWLKLTLAGITLVALGLGLAVSVGSFRWNRATSRLNERLLSRSSIPGREAFRPEQLQGLPPPVARYFRSVLKPDQPMIRAARLEWRGEFNMGASAQGSWKPFDATQRFTGAPAGFVWDARIRVAPFVTARVRDAYVGGAGSMQAKLAAVVTMLDEHGRTELNRGALQRYLAEAVWFPTALLPREGLDWTAIDDSTALATLTESGITVSLQFRFDPTGDVVGAYAPDRPRAVDGGYQPTPWAGRFRSHAVRNGVRIPLEGEVEWILPGGTLPYWRGRVVSSEYDLPH
ncbi:MAG: hypothetical protein HY700_08650 [Gemmatimonadetes bacterium]|nr:hypothetical protein [Gemmatimonadota bacterium]